MKEEFITRVEMGFGRIFQGDIKKYWTNEYGEELSEEQYDELVNILHERSLIIDETDGE